MPLTGIKHILLVLSGKGGVGKSSVTTQLALTLSLQGFSVGVLDIDLTGPSIPRFFGIEGEKVTQAPGGLVPVSVHQRRGKSIDGKADSTEVGDRAANGKGTGSRLGTGPETPAVKKSKEIPSFGPLSCISLGFILSSRDAAVIWRGPKKTAMVRQFLTSTLWPADLDFLLIDTPPGTSDEHISLVETLLKEANPTQLAGAVVVTTPQAIAVADVKKELNFCKKTGVKVCGVVENMAGFVCPNCSECTNVFSKGGGQVMAAEFGVPFLGSVPIDPAFVELIEVGTRPRYPAGTVVAGRDVSVQSRREEEGSGVGEVREEAEDGGLLVEKYTDCSLYEIFDGIVGKLVADLGS